MSGIGQRIRAARSLRGWSQNELASRAGIKQPTLHRIEAGARQDPSIRTIAAIAAALEMTIDALVVTANDGTPGRAPRLVSTTPETLAQHLAELEERFDRRIAAIEHTMTQKGIELLR